MQITKFAQSCFLIETNNKRILIDPGNIQYRKEYLNEQWANIDYVFITHKHGDHCHIEAIKEIQKKSKVYSSSEVSATYADLDMKIVKEGEILKLDGIKVEVVKAIHGFLPHLVDDKAINENIGYIIDDGKKRLYHTSDTVCFANDYSCDIVCVPVCNHSLVMGPFAAAWFSKETGAEVAIPMHYDNPDYPMSLDDVKIEFDKREMKCEVLNIGESIEI